MALMAKKIILMQAIRCKDRIFSGIKGIKSEVFCIFGAESSKLSVNKLYHDSIPHIFWLVLHLARVVRCIDVNKNRIL